jgi:cytochrome c oxidase subunit III
MTKSKPLSTDSLQADGTQSVPATLASHFDTPEQQYDSARLGMWIFLLTEALFFGGLFCAYAVFRAVHPEMFVDGHLLLDKPLGAANTVVLIFSSLTMALAVRAAQLGQRRALIGPLTITLLCGLVFLGVKAVEYKHKWDHSMLPGQARIVYWFSRESGPEPSKEFRPDEAYIRERLARVGADEDLGKGELARRAKRLGTFMGIYFLLTGLHAMHVFAGIGAIGWILVGAIRGRFGSSYFTPVDLVGLYWHLVDMIWIFLFPLLYLIH